MGVGARDKRGRRTGRHRSQLGRLVRAHRHHHRRRRGPRAGERTKVTVGHTKLATLDDVHVWKQFWGDWLDALDGTVPNDAVPNDSAAG